MKVNISFFDPQINKVVEFVTNSDLSLVKMAQDVKGKALASYF